MARLRLDVSHKRQLNQMIMKKILKI